jgi:hypothetical protein
LAPRFVRTNLTDNAGDFTLAGLTGATYTVSASLAGYRFTPLSNNVAVTTGSVSGLAFTADGAYQIAGIVTNGITPVANVTITVSNALLVRSVRTRREGDTRCPTCRPPSMPSAPPPRAKISSRRPLTST